MAKIYRILGKRGNTTIPYALRVFLGFRPNDLLSFRAESDEVIIRREKICDDCCTSEHRADAPPLLRHCAVSFPLCLPMFRRRPSSI